MKAATQRALVRIVREQRWWWEMEGGDFEVYDLATHFSLSSCHGMNAGAL